MNKELSILPEIRTKYPFVTIYAWEDNIQIYISSIKIPKEHRRKGIGKDIISIIKNYAYEQQKPITLSPEAEKGYKKKLDTFYRNLGFVHNQGRNKDYSLSRTFGKTMYWKPRKFQEFLKEKDNQENI
jgi:GNAT superfamily N-acetyltransferase